MQRNRATMVMVTALGAAAIGCAFRVGPQSFGDIEAVRVAWERASVALCSGDTETYRQLWAIGPEVELLHPDGPQRIVGSGSILSYYRQVLSSG